MVLLVVSLNISGMMQVRGAMRERELSIRQAIGASRARLAQYLLSEAIVLACAGGALASLVLFNVPSLLSWLTGNVIPAQLQEALRVNLPMVAIIFGICLLTSLVFGWLPAMRFSRPVIISSLKDDAGSGGGMRVGRVHRWTAALQVAIAVPLLVMSGQSLDRMRATATSDLGFASDLLYAVPLKLDGLTIDQAGFQIRKASDTLAHASGVASVTVADGLPLDFRGRTHLRVAAGRREHRAEAGCRAGDARRRRLSEDDGHSARARARIHRRGWCGRRAGDHRVETARRSSRARTAT